MVRGFAVYLQTIDPATEVPPTVCSRPTYDAKRRIFIPKLRSRADHDRRWAAIPVARRDLPDADWAPIRQTRDHRHPHRLDARPEEITMHVLRHTAAMRLLHAGVETSVIAFVARVLREPTPPRSTYTPPSRNKPSPAPPRQTAPRTLPTAKHHPRIPPEPSMIMPTSPPVHRMRKNSPSNIGIRQSRDKRHHADIGMMGFTDRRMRRCLPS